MLNNIAIVIPAYKNVYLESTLDSLSQQSDKNFTVYIGDDNSPYGLKKIVDKYLNLLDIVYRHFDTNMGGINLIQHWNRCLKMMSGEEFFCLFSDDDIMQPMCIQMFNEVQKEYNNFDVYHFNLDIIDNHGNVLKECNKFPSYLSTEDFLSLLYSDQIDARMPEFIFRTQHFYRSGGFVDFDLGFRTDNATVLTCAKEKGISTIPNTKVLWRDSGINISSSQNTALKIRRIYASVDFFNWLECYYRDRSEECPLNLRQRIKLVISELLALMDILSIKELEDILRKVNSLKQNNLLYLRYKFSMLNKIRKQRRWKK